MLTTLDLEQTHGSMIPKLYGRRKQSTTRHIGLGLGFDRLVVAGISEASTRKL
jgi:hypothetical protein